MSRLAAFAAAMFALACTVPALQRQFIATGSLPARSDATPYLKAHLKSGELIIWTAWTQDSAARSVSGPGKRYDLDRRVRDSSSISISLDSVALFESNVTRNHGSAQAMTVVASASLLLSVACLTNPKACFGSCPTFYVGDSASGPIAAEGFSASIAPALEATDVDALYRARPASTRFTVKLTNEALETHVIRHAKILAALRPAEGHVYATQTGEFWAAGAAITPTACSAPEGDCLGALGALDDAERFSVSDSTDLAAREVIELEFPRVAGDTLGLVIASRQTLMSTFVLYHALAKLGRSATAVLASLETHGRVRDRVTGPADVLGGIEVRALDRRGRWQTVGETRETGPLATDVRVVVFPNPGDARRIQLRLTKGHWRIDHVALVPLKSRVRPLVLDPVRVTRDGHDDADALDRLVDTTRALVTIPGDAYTLEYMLPADFARYDLFLESRGYYLEWMREQWLAEENVTEGLAMFRNPRRAMRDLAPAFKKQEASMESAFWSSRYVRH